MRVEHEYDRGGALAYLAALDVHRATVIGRCAPTTGIAPFGELVEQVMTPEPYASARRVFWIVDNGSSHAGQASVDRMREAWPTATLVHLPIHASWLNQIEIYFSIVQRKVVKPDDFADLDRARTATARLPRPLQRHRQPVRLALHQDRPQRLPQTTRRPRATQPRGLTPEELTSMTTSARR